MSEYPLYLQGDAGEGGWRREIACLFSRVLKLCLAGCNTNFGTAWHTIRCTNLLITNLYQYCFHTVFMPYWPQIICCTAHHYFLVLLPERGMCKSIILDSTIWRGLLNYFVRLNAWINSIIQTNDDDCRFSEGVVGIVVRGNQVQHCERLAAALEVLFQCSRTYVQLAEQELG